MNRALALRALVEHGYGEKMASLPEADLEFIYRFIRENERLTYHEFSAAIKHWLVAEARHMLPEKYNRVCRIDDILIAVNTLWLILNQKPVPD